MQLLQPTNVHNSHHTLYITALRRVPDTTYPTYRQTYKQYQPGGDVPVGGMHYLLTYLSYIRLNTTVQRNLIIIENTEARRRERAKVGWSMEILYT